MKTAPEGAASHSMDVKELLGSLVTATCGEGANEARTENRKRNRFRHRQGAPASHHSDPIIGQQGFAVEHVQREQIILTAPGPAEVQFT